MPSEDKKNKISLEEIKELSPQFLMRLINKAKKFLKEDSAMLDAFTKHDVDIEILDLIPITFDDLDVSAQTRAGIVYLNYALLCDGDFFKDYGYLIHEITHVLQQAFGDKPTQGSDDGNYLDNKSEQEAFQYQAEFLANEFGQEEAEEYIEDLLDHHEVPKKEKEEKKDLLLAKANINFKKQRIIMNLKEKINMFYKLAQMTSAQPGDIEQVLKSNNLWDLSKDVAPLIAAAGTPDSSSIDIQIVVSPGSKVSFLTGLNPTDANMAVKLSTLLTKKYSGLMSAALVKAKLNVEEPIQVKWLTF